MSTPTDAPPLRFGRFELQPHERRVLMDGSAVPLGGRAFDLLVALAVRAGQLVDKRTLMDLVWPGLVVEENNLAAQVSALRRVLGDGVVATVPGRGYRFVARLEAAPGREPAVPLDTPPRTPVQRTNLPGELPALIGRDDDLAALGALVDAHRLVTVAGAGGVGKSLLVQHLLAARRGVYPHGVCWIELAAIASADALPGAVLAALGADARSALPGAVSALTMLIALDNAEHLLADVAALASTLLDRAPGVRIVVTSQAPLRLPTEQVLRLGGLAVPEGPLPAADALRHGAVALFVARARTLDRRFGLAGETDVLHAIEVCRALDGLPLAIELAAARAPLLGVARLRESMRDRFALLTQGRNRAAPERQRTLRAAIAWSHDLLAPREQRVFRRLAVVAGSASLALVAAVASEAEDADADRWAILDALDVLVDRSLVAVLPDADGSEPRYRLLETPRAYASEQMDAAGERADAARRHARAVGDQLDAAYAQYFDGSLGVDDWLRRCEPDLDNAREALAWARAARDAASGTAGDTSLQLRIGSTLLRALPLSLHAERLALADACEACLAAGDVPEPLQLRGWVELSCALADPQKERARRAAERAVALARSLDRDAVDRFPLYHALSRAAGAAAQLGDLPCAREQLAEALSLEDAAWPPHRVLWRVEAAWWVERMAGNAAAALAHGRHLLALDRARGSLALIATSNLIDAELAAGDPAAAARLGSGLVEALQGTRHEYNLAFARLNLLAALLALDDTAQVRPLAEVVWAKAPLFAVEHAASAYLALLVALEGHAEAAVGLAAYSEAAYALRREEREPNETAATERARAIARRTLDEATFAHAHAAGAKVASADVARLAFGAAE